MTRFPRLAKFLDRIVAVQVVLIVAGTALAFGGAVWWMKPTLAVLATMLAITSAARAAMLGRLVVLRSPMTALGVLALMLAAAQVVPLPGRLAAMASPSARSAHALGVLPDRARLDDPSAVLPEVVADRTPTTIDRPATLRWLFGAAACLAVFCACAQFADRLRHSVVVWGSVVGACFVGTAFGLAQILGGSSGLYGAIEPGSGSAIAPTSADLAAAPGRTLLRPISGDDSGTTSWSVARPEHAPQLGTMLGGAAAYLALAALALPLGLGLTLHSLAPRGSREPLAARLRASGRSGLVVLLGLMTLATAGLSGYLAGPWLAAPFGLAVLVVGLPSARSSGLRWIGVGITAATFAALAGGAFLSDPSARDSSASMAESWRQAGAAARSFPLVGSGLGTYPTIAAYYKSTDPTPTTAGSSLAQWLVESGTAGGAILFLGAIWCVVKLPGAIRRVGSADKTLAYSLLGAIGGFACVSAVHWTVELMAVALAAAAVAGTCNRWLAGGTDLFVEMA